MHRLDCKACCFLIVFPVIAFAIGCFFSCFQGATRWILFAIGFGLVFATAIFSIKEEKIVDGGTF